MAYDGTTWNENIPTDDNQASTIDNYHRDGLKAVRSRMAQEHVWPASQTGTNEAGWHTFITMSAQTSTPSLVYGTSTQEGCIFIDANNHLTFEDSAGATYIIAKSGAGVALGAGTGTLGSIAYITAGGSTVLLAASADGYVLKTHSGTGPPTFEAESSTTLGSWVAKTIDTTYTATSDGFVTASIKHVSGAVETLEGQSPAGTTRGIATAGVAGDKQDWGGSMCFPVKSGDNYTVVSSGGAGASHTKTFYFIPQQ